VAKQMNPHIEEIRRLQLLERGVPSPFDCWLIHRAIGTLVAVCACMPRMPWRLRPRWTGTRAYRLFCTRALAFPSAI